MGVSMKMSFLDGCQTPRIKTESLHFTHNLSVLFQNQWFKEVKCQKRIIIPLFMDVCNVCNFQHWWKTLEENVAVTLQLLTDSDRLVLLKVKGSLSLGFTPTHYLSLTLPPCPVQQVPQCDLDWECGMLGMWVFERWPFGTMCGRSMTAWLWSWLPGLLKVTEWPRLDHGSLSTGCPTPLMSDHRNSWCSSTFLPIPHYTGRPPIFEKMSRQV